MGTPLNQKSNNNNEKLKFSLAISAWTVLSSSIGTRSPIAIRCALQTLARSGSPTPYIKLICKLCQPCLSNDGAVFLLLFPAKRRLVGSFKLALANKYARVRQQLSPILGQIIDASIDAFAQRPLTSSALYLYLKNLQLFFRCFFFFFFLPTF